MIGLAGCNSPTNEQPGGGADPTSTPLADPASATFEFEYSDGSLTIRHAGGPSIPADHLVIRSSDGTRVRWHELGSTAVPAGGEVTPGDSATIDSSVRNWPTDVDPSETILVVYASEEGSPTTIARFDRSRTPSATETAAETDELIFSEDFEAYDLGRRLGTVQGWTVTNYPSGYDDAFEIEGTYPDVVGQKSLSTVPDDGNFQVNAHNTNVDSWTFPESGFRFEAVLSTEGETQPPDAFMPSAGVICDGHRAGIELDTTDFNGPRGIRFDAFSGDRTYFGEIDAESYEIELVGRPDRTVTASARPPGSDDWVTHSVRTDVTGDVEGVHLHTNNGGQFDLLRLRNEADPVPSSDG